MFPFNITAPLSGRLVDKVFYTAHSVCPLSRAMMLTGKLHHIYNRHYSIKRVMPINKMSSFTIDIFNQ